MKIVFIVVLVLLCLVAAVLYCMVAAGSKAERRVKQEFNDYLRRRQKMFDEIADKNLEEIFTRLSENENES